MSIKIFVLLCALSLASAYPYADFVGDSEPYEESPTFFVADGLEEVPVIRAKRQWQLQGGGGGSPGKGYGVGLQASGPVWTSDNGRHIVGASGSYSQFLGGPYGSSKPDLGVGASYTFKF